MVATVAAVRTSRKAAGAGGGGGTGLIGVGVEIFSAGTYGEIVGRPR